MRNGDILEDICLEKTILEETTSLLLNQSEVLHGEGNVLHGEEGKGYNSLKSDYKKVVSLPSYDMFKPGGLFT